MKKIILFGIISVLFPWNLCAQADGDAARESVAFVERWADYCRQVKLEVKADKACLNEETFNVQDYMALFPALAVDSSKGDVILAVYQDKRNDDVIYILEYGKNALFDRYALWEWDTWHKSEGSYDSVISSALWNRAYTVEGDTATVWLTRHRSRNVIFSAQLMIFGSLLFALTFMKPKGKEEYGA